MTDFSPVPRQTRPLSRWVWHCHLKAVAAPAVLSLCLMVEVLRDRPAAVGIWLLIGLALGYGALLLWINHQSRAQTRYLGRPLHDLAEALRYMSQGEYRKRISPSGIQELDEMAELVATLGEQIGTIKQSESELRRENEALQAQLAQQAATPADISPALTEADQTLPVGGLRILMAEAHPVNQMVVLALLKMLGHEAVLAQDGREALAAYIPGRFDVALFDLNMLEMDGLALTEQIRRLEKGTGTRLPIIGLGLAKVTGEEQRCLAAGMDGYLAKPIHRETLEQQLNAAVSRRTQPDSSARVA